MDRGDALQQRGTRLSKTPICARAQGYVLRLVSCMYFGSDRSWDVWFRRREFGPTTPARSNSGRASCQGKRGETKLRPGNWASRRQPDAIEGGCETGDVVGNGQQSVRAVADCCARFLQCKAARCCLSLDVLMTNGSADATDSTGFPQPPAIDQPASEANRGRAGRFIGALLPPPPLPPQLQVVPRGPPSGNAHIWPEQEAGRAGISGLAPDISDHAAAAHGIAAGPDG